MTATNATGPLDPHSTVRTAAHSPLPASIAVPASEGPETSPWVDPEQASSTVLRIALCEDRADPWGCQAQS